MSTKILSVHKDSIVRDVQHVFAEWYPYLRINFFLTRNNVAEPSRQGVVFMDSVKLSEINPAFGGAIMEVEDNMTIRDFENKFFEQFGLPVEVSRRSGNLWLDTARTSQWTLKEQNDHGQAISPGQKPPDFSQVPYGC